MEKMRNAYKIWSKNLTGIDHIDQSVEGRIIDWFLEKQGVGAWIAFN
jgi:hypothetical protein